jgi:hypothetical protein
LTVAGQGRQLDTLSRQPPAGLTGRHQQEVSMEQQAREQAFITALVTEHFALQSARSATIGEANGRAAIYHFGRQMV